MTSRLAAAALLGLALSTSGALLAVPVVHAAGILQGNADDDAAIRRLLTRLEQIVQRADVPAYLELVSTTADPGDASKFAATEFRPGATRVVIQERDRQDLPGTLPGNGYTIIVDAFIERHDNGRVATWSFDVRRAGSEWLIGGQTLVSSVENLHRLSITSTKQFDAHNFTVSAEDIELTLAEGTVFVVETEQGVTGLVLLGAGQMSFHPSPETEKGQARIFAGAETIDSRFDAAWVRLGYYQAHADPTTLVARPVDPRDLKRAQQVFDEESIKSYTVDLGDLARDPWSLTPGPDDFLAEVRTRRFNTLTYAKSSSESEDISFFERRRHRNIAVYASQSKLATRGRFYNEDDLTAFDVLNYDIEVTALPDRAWIEGRAVMRLKVRAPSIGQLTIHLADSLVVRSMVSNRFGRLFNLRVTNQNTVLVNLPSAMPKGTEMTLTIEYSGRLAPQSPDREALVLQRDPLDTPQDDRPATGPEASFLYSNATFWYPQSPVTDYATANIQITVPDTYGCVASGEQASYSPEYVTVREAPPGRKVYTFTAERPVRYLAFLVTRLTRADRWTVAFDKEIPPDGPVKATPPATAPPPRGGAPYKKLDLIVESNPRQAFRGKLIAESAVEIYQYYQSIVGDSPYSAFTVALVESKLPGGHSPGYFAELGQPMDTTNVTWRFDPATFTNFPEFFLAHETAHQWWGQAVGWRNYHEQWLSEGFAQYFAALYAQKFKGDDVFNGVMRQMRRWAMDQSDQGPVYLGYRVGHIKGDSKAFRAVVYNKGAAVLHMLRRFVGDDAFFRGIRRFYDTSRYTKVGTEDLRFAMERESGKPLERFFERWIYGSTLPKVTFSYRVEPAEGEAGGSSGQQVVLHFEQTGDIFDLPVTVNLQYADRKAGAVIVPITDRIVDVRVPLEGVLRSAEISRDDGTLADVQRN